MFRTSVINVFAIKVNKFHLLVILFKVHDHFNSFTVMCRDLHLLLQLIRKFIVCYLLITIQNIIGYLPWKQKIKSLQFLKISRTLLNVSSKHKYNMYTQMVVGNYWLETLFLESRNWTFNFSTIDLSKSYHFRTPTSTYNWNYKDTFTWSLPSLHFLGICMSASGLSHK